MLMLARYRMAIRALAANAPVLRADRHATVRTVRPNLLHTDDCC
jgi:hypothetical protein